VVVLLAALLLGGVSWLVGSQVTSLLGEFPKYSENIEDKIHSFQKLTKDNSLGGMIRSLSASWNHPQEAERPEREPASSRSTPPETPTTVVLKPNELPWLGLVPSILAAVLEGFTQAGLAVVLTIFMLLKREDLRNRFIRLVGHGHVTVTTKAVDDAGQRISRYLFRQLIINAAFGMLVALGLFLIGVDYAILWGFLAGALRYVPYVGTTVASLLPIALSLIQFAGWQQPILVVVLILGLEFVMANVLEPRFYGPSIGVSEIGMLIAAAFWAYLWGPIGLVLSGPMTVCLVVLGKYVPRLEFFNVLLGDEPVLDPHVTFYQRLAAADPVEAVRVVQEYVQTTSCQRVYDDLLVPALVRARRDRARDLLTDDDEKFIMETAAGIVEDLKINVREHESGARNQESEDSRKEAESREPPTTQSSPLAVPPVSILGFPARVEADWVGLKMLERLLEAGKWSVEVLGDQWLSSELLSMVEKGRPDVVCIGSMPPGGLTNARYLCKRLRKRYPKLKIVVGRWGLKRDQEENRHLIQEAGADHVGFTLLETRDHLQAWLPILAQGNAAQKGRKRLKEEVSG
jgi:predicted PurR-regulated permease PerM